MTPQQPNTLVQRIAGLETRLRRTQWIAVVGVLLGLGAGAGVAWTSMPDDSICAVGN